MGRGSQEVTKNQTKRIAITVSVSSTAQATRSCQERRPFRASTMLGSWRPTSVKSTALRMKRVMSQTAAPCRRVCAVVSSGVYQPM